MDPNLEDGQLTEEKGSLRPNTFWNRITQHKFLTLSLVATIIIALGIGLGVGLGVGLNPKDESAPTKSVHVTNDPTQAQNITTPLLKNTTALWQPPVGASWQIVLQNPIDASGVVAPDVLVFDIDLYDNPKETIDKMHSQGRKVICYFSAGTYESYRPDSSQFTKADLGKQLSGWPGEYWLNTESQNVRDIMTARIQLAADKGCDAIDPENMDGYETLTGFPLTTNTALNYLTFLATTAASLNLSIGLKNAGTIAASAVNTVQFSIVESCTVYNECAFYRPFVNAAKPVFLIEYPDGAPGKVKATTLLKYCQVLGNGNTGFSEIVKDLSLDGWVEFCTGVTDTTATVSG